MFQYCWWPKYTKYGCLVFKMKSTIFLFLIIMDIPCRVRKCSSGVFFFPSYWNTHTHTHRPADQALVLPLVTKESLSHAVTLVLANSIRNEERPVRQSAQCGDPQFNLLSCSYFLGKVLVSLLWPHTPQHAESYTVMRISRANGPFFTCTD